MKKQIVFVESYPEIMVYKMARIFKEKGYETVSIRLLKSKGLSEDFYKKAYDKIIRFNLDYHKLNLKNLPAILNSSLKGLKDFNKAVREIRKLKPYIVLGRAYPSWPIAITRFLYKGLLIYFPYDIRSITQVSQPTSTNQESNKNQTNQTNKDKKSTKRLSDMKQFELNAEKYCFQNADGIIHKGSPEEIEHLKNGIYKNIKISDNIINILPYCSKEFIIPINKNKLSKKDKEIHTVYIGASGGTDPKGTCDELFDYSRVLADQKIHSHFYMKPNTLSKEEIVKLYRNAAGDLFDTGYFHLHQPLEPDEVVKEISKYDFGWTFYNHVDDEQGYTDLNAKFTTGNKIASYLEAGLPFFYSTSFDFLHETMKKYNLDLPIKDLDEATKIGQMIKKINYNKLIKDVEKAREDYSMEKHFTRIEEFVENTIKNNKNKRLKKNIKNNSLNKSISQNYTTRTSCRLCNQPSELVLQFEPTPHGDAYLSKGREQDTKEKFPLDLMLCKDCEFIQLKHIVNPKILYRNYIYQSSDSLGLQKYFADYASSILANETNSKNKLAVDIGSNEGLLLSSLKEKGMRVLGVEPAKEIAERANAKGIKTINQFFNTETAEKIKQNHGQANIITANHVFANIDNIDNLIDGIKTLLSPNGTFIIETANLSDIINNNIFDNIYHEHLSYFSIKSLKLYLEKNGMELFNVTHSPIKGGSIRLSFQFKNSAKKPISQNVNNFLKPEEKSKLSNKETYKNFGNRINEEGKRINNILNKLSKNGEIAGFGAAVGSTTMIYQWHLEKHLRYLVDDNPSRHNLLSPGLQLPVLPPSTLNKKNPIATLILAWRYSDPIIKNNKSYIEDGGSFIIPFSESNINKTY